MQFPFISRRPNRQLQDLLIAHADALISGTVDLDQLLTQYQQVDRSQVADLLTLAEQVNRTLIQVVPSDYFVERLRHQLIDEGITLGQRSLLERIRHLPPRTQLAAGIGGATLTAGVVLIASRPVWWGAVVDWRSRRS